MPTVERLAAVGEGGRTRFCAVEGDVEPEGRAFFSLFGLDARLDDEGDLPLGYLAAVGAGLRPDAGLTWGRLAFTHLLPKRNDLVFVSPERTGQSDAERWQLAQAMSEPLAESGWRLAGGEGGPLLVSRSSPLPVETRSLSGLEGKPFREYLPRGEGGRELLTLLTAGQLCLARHPLNLQRKNEGRLPLNTPWIWGVGSGAGFAAPEPPPAGGHCWSDDPQLAGLASLCGFSCETLNENGGIDAGLVARVAETPGVRLVHFQQPGVLARHGMMPERTDLLARLDAAFLQPVTARLSGSETLIIGTPYSLTADGAVFGRPAPWVTAGGKGLRRKKWFWHRGRFGDGPVLNVADFRQRWWS